MRFTFHPNEKRPITLSYHVQLSRHHTNYFFCFFPNYSLKEGLITPSRQPLGVPYCITLNDQAKIVVFRNHKIRSLTLKLLKLNTPFLTRKSFFKWRAFSRAIRGCNFYTTRVKLDQILYKYYMPFYCVSAVIYLR